MEDSQNGQISVLATKPAVQELRNEQEPAQIHLQPTEARTAKGRQTKCRTAMLNLVPLMEGLQSGRGLANAVRTVVVDFKPGAVHVPIQSQLMVERIVKGSTKKLRFAIWNLVTKVNTRERAFAFPQVTEDRHQCKEFMFMRRAKFKLGMCKKYRRKID